MARIRISELLKDGAKFLGQKIEVKGWVRAFRSKRFVQLNDGSCMSNIQGVLDYDNFDEEQLKAISTGAAVCLKGILIESQGSGQVVELQVESFDIIGSADPEAVQKTILQPKKHSLDLLREQAHLRFRTNTFGAVFRIRHAASFAIHQFFNDRGFNYIHTPILTGSDAEGAGEMFRVSTLDPKNPPLDEDGDVDYGKDFFGKQVNLTVSGQLEAELAALGLGQVYTFGPTFRAENSNTSRHLAEFWMIEPEVAFNDLVDNMDLTEEFLQSVCGYILENCAEDLTFLDKRYGQEQSQKPQNERSHLGLLESIKFVVDNKFKRLSYTEAIDVLRNSKAYKKKKFQFPVEWGIDLQSEHERYLVEKEFKCPVILSDYPADIKAFYMRQNDDGKTVAAMDVLFPGVGEIVGGSQREERLEVLRSKCKDFDIEEEELWWYMDTRKFGSVPHAGFGMGFERLIMFLTGMSNIRDVIPFPRTPDNAEF
ncbi:MAG: asparagine--tRNA ligase [Crocinitomicaceae bacterium]|jgi:asparaginyl-tRNA synthetase|nr:asparagine--tRNA ligase [Crocinitomicaceae bacterium]MDG1350856.1 asparagine--tRNA ligase [Crocinitomicaceae bacterium]MDG1735788.1 asparagine--tRNA ligase [Crocinitomicaceae bacterium]MDG2506109.1 asparagine--tRNA ligase [Crocinitomicaceae bacterium]